jgi:hypothetical protein
LVRTLKEEDTKNMSEKENLEGRSRKIMKRKREEEDIGKE